MSLSQKQKQLRAVLKPLGRALVAYSGGVDSALVLAVAHQELGEQVLAVTARSASVPKREWQAAAALAQTLGARHRFIETAELDLPNYAKNPVNRCFYCKSELYTRLQQIADKEGYPAIVNGTNQDDLGDHRPGLESAEAFGVHSPLCAAGFSKQDVRALSRELGLPTWEKPAMPCLASRIPYGQEVTREKLSMVERAEDYLLSLGYRELRVRHFGGRARIELPQNQIARFKEGPHWALAKRRLRAIGFDQVEVDPEGFRSGKLNSAILPR